LSLVIPIILLAIVLTALTAIYLSTKNWHWSQVLLLAGIFFAGMGYLVLATETMRIHRNLRANISTNEKKLVTAVQNNEAILHGSDDPAIIGRLFAGDSPLDDSAEKMEGILNLEHRLQLATRKRGRVWRGVLPAGQVGNEGRVAVEIASPQPHGLETETIVFAFEAGQPNLDNGPQYLGEFRVVEADPQGAMLEPVLLINRRTDERLAGSQGPWSLYESMPIDSHKLFAGFSEEQLRNMLPESSVAEYLRHGKKATNDDDQWHRAGYDEDGRRVGPDNAQAVEFRYDRTLRDYAFLFGEIARQQVVLLADIVAVQEDNAKQEGSLVIAEKISVFREKELQTLTSDLEGMAQDRSAIEKHLQAVGRHLENAKKLVDRTLATNSHLAKRLADHQLGLLRYIDDTAPAA